METFWAALGGALVGGIASTLGSLIVSKRTQTRTFRARIYDELLPELTRIITTGEAALEPGQRVHEALDSIRTAGHVIGGPDTTKVNELHRLYEVWQGIHKRFQKQDAAGWPVLVLDRPEDEAAYKSAKNGFLEAVDGYREWLRRRLDMAL
jgi:hypothetical protein